MLSIFRTAIIIIPVIHILALPNSPNPTARAVAQSSESNHNAEKHHPNLVVRVLPNQPAPSTASEPSGSDAGSFEALQGPSAVENSNDMRSSVTKAFGNTQDGGEKTHSWNTVLFRTLTAERQDGGKGFNAEIASRILDRPEYWLKTGRKTLQISLNKNAIIDERWESGDIPTIEGGVPQIIPVVDVKYQATPVETTILSNPLSRATRGVRFDFESQDSIPGYFKDDGATPDILSENDPALEDLPTPWLEARITPAENDPNRKAKTKSLTLHHELEPRHYEFSSFDIYSTPADQGWHTYSFSIEIKDILQGRTFEAGDQIQLVAHAVNHMREVTVKSASMQLFSADEAIDQYGSKLAADIDPQSQFFLVSNAVFVAEEFNIKPRPRVTVGIGPGIVRDDKNLTW